MIVIIDNYDSFTYNLYQYIGEIDPDVKVIRNDEITIEDLLLMKPQHIIISPGPGYPSSAGISKEVIECFGKVIPILGVCLGHQAIAEVFGGEIIESRLMFHGKTSRIRHDGKGLFKNIINPLTVMRYHSLKVNDENLPEEIVITARTEDGEIMGLKHRDYPIHGVQFHPESVMTECGKEILRNFLNM